MLNQATLDKMQAMRLSAMAEGSQKQLESPQLEELSFEERLGMLVDGEWTAREQRKLARRLKGAKLRHQACLEDADFKVPRGLDRQVILSLGSCARPRRRCHANSVRRKLRRNAVRSARSAARRKRKGKGKVSTHCR
ncbi:MAG: hypothetical protein GF355_10960 [Candidatus Eisenbacteria bacterium]|nr:hypothetical protein [Candidatus Eisenbacteria bacterium]